DLRRGVDALRIDGGVLGEDQRAVLAVAVEVLHLRMDVPVLLRGAGHVELEEIDLEVDDRLEKVQGAEDGGGDGVVRAPPGLTDMRLRGEVEDDGPAAPAQFSDGRVDRRLVREIAAVDPKAVAEMADVAQLARAGGPHERAHVGAVLDELLDEMGSYEAVGPRDEACATPVFALELFQKTSVLRLRRLCPIARRRRKSPATEGRPHRPLNLRSVPRLH